MSEGFFGEYNNIYFITKEDKITRIYDRAHRKNPVCFEEIGLEDLNDMPRDTHQLSMKGGFPSTDSDQETEIINIAGQQFEVIGTHYISMPFMGYGRSLRYRVVVTDSDRIAVILTVTLPEKSRYKIKLKPISQDGPDFTLHENMTITVISELSWQFENETFVVETGTQKGEVSFLVESIITPIQVLKTIVIAAKGREREAFLARAAIGRGFAPCFVLNPQEEIDKVELQHLFSEISYNLVISIGLPFIKDLEDHTVRVLELDNMYDSSVEISALLGNEKPNFILHISVYPNIYGPALLLSLCHNAGIKFEKTENDKLYLTDIEGNCLQEWELFSLLGTPLQFLENKDQALSVQKPNEMVMCESTLNDLLICQAIGYADLRMCDIAFIPQIKTDVQVEMFEKGEDGIKTLEQEAAKAVPSDLRSPSTKILTIFTCYLPLHLIPLIHNEEDASTTYWMDCYTLAHMPGQTASQLVPRFFSESLREAPSVSFSVIFDTFSDYESTEGAMYAEELARGLSYPILLQSESASKEVLKEILQRFDTDLILLIAHGEDNYLLDSLNDEISNQEVASWHIKSNPLVFSNSCTSWTTTGSAFLKAGARALISSLWPVESSVASEIAAKFAKKLLTDIENDIPILIADAISEVSEDLPNKRETASAYIYVGLPGTYLLSRPVIDHQESVALLGKIFDIFNDVAYEIVSEGRPDLAITIDQVISSAIRNSCKKLLIPGEKPLILPQPMSRYSLLEIDLLLAMKSFELGRQIVERLPLNENLPIIDQMGGFLGFALQELLSWNERHDRHENISEEQKKEREEWAKNSPIFVGVLDDASEYKLMVQFTFDYILPFIRILTRTKEADRARGWLEIAAKMVTTPADISPDGSVKIETLINRIQTGVQQKHKVVWSAEKHERDRVVTIDLLGQAVNKAELLNRFGIAYKSLEDFDIAIAFFEAAKSMADPLSQDYANITSNLSTTLFESNKGDSTDDYYESFNKQIGLGDFGNALVTFANILRFSANLNKTVDESLLNAVFTYLDNLDASSEKAKHSCDLLGALACYYASRGNYNAAERTCREIANFLQEPYPVSDIARHLNEVIKWYYDREDYDNALKLGFMNANYLLKAEMLADAILTFCANCETALLAYDQNPDDCYIEEFFSSSKQIGNMLKRKIQINSRFEEYIENIWFNTKNIWKQVSSIGKIELALEAYETVRIWEREEKDKAWETLRNTVHKRNLESIQLLAKSNSLHREATVFISSDLQVAVHKLTKRKDTHDLKEMGCPSIVYGYLPLYKSSVPKVIAGDDVFFVMNRAVYSIRNEDQIEILEKSVRALTTYGIGKYQYQEIWGSKTIPYDVTILLAPGLIPLEIQCRTRSKNSPSKSIWFDNGSCHVHLKSKGNGAEAWLAEITIVFVRIAALIPELINLTNKKPPRKLSFEQYLDFLDELNLQDYSIENTEEISTEVIRYEITGFFSSLLENRNKLNLMIEFISDILHKIIISLLRYTLLYSDERTELLCVSREEYEQNIELIMIFLKPFGQALYENKYLREKVCKNEEFTKIFQAIGGELIYKILPDKGLSFQEIFKLTQPFIRCLAIINDPYNDSLPQ